DRWLPAADGPAATVARAMRYAVEAGGKRLRPILALTCCEVCGGKAADVEAPAAALEMIHTYSLIHDDLPAMDDDDLRRGRPTVHRAFGEAEAILAGDALNTLAFELLATQPGGDEHARRRTRAVSLVARRAG
ncbi:MAG: geranyl transferase, partial [Acidobacteria bacterium]|nr:geranyl transferase [Acidobacteriota bacterium]NIO60956.1 geranyl transferase [Acidobacteriota bacterium]NIQ31969.1 geranyl transferase [Acidobacteriota bacterium]NIQ87454.1 geranyl transferase [Acidobacteriota bacterium]